MTAGAPGEPQTTDDGLRYITARRPWELVDWRELWEHRELLWILGMRDLTVRYRQTLVGVAWALLQPLTQMTIFAVMFGLLGKQPSTGNVPYPLVVLSGLLLWQLFASIVTQGTQSLVANQGMVGKVYFPRLVLPLCAVIPAGADFIVSVALFLILALWYGVTVSTAWLLLPLFVLASLVFATAMGVLLAAVNSMYRDVGFAVPFLIQLGFFVSPVVYETRALIPERYWPLYYLNPLASILDGFRASLFGVPAPPWWGVVLGAIVSLCWLVLGLAYFRRIERFVADRI